MQTHVNCTKRGCQEIPTRSGDLNCSAADNDQTIKKMPAIMEQINLPTLIVVPSGLLSLWERESSKSISNGVLRIRIAHSERHENFTDLYQSLEGGTRNDHRLNDIVVLTS